MQEKRECPELLKQPKRKLASLKSLAITIKQNRMCCEKTGVMSARARAHTHTHTHTVKAIWLLNILFLGQLSPLACCLCVLSDRFKTSHSQRGVRNKAHFIFCRIKKLFQEGPKKQQKKNKKRPNIHTEWYIHRHTHTHTCNAKYMSSSILTSNESTLVARSP